MNMLGFRAWLDGYLLGCDYPSQELTSNEIDDLIIKIKTIKDSSELTDKEPTESLRDFPPYKKPTIPAWPFDIGDVTCTLGG